MDLVTKVERDHDDLLALAATAVRSGADGRRDRRQIDRLVAAATRHTAAEEQYLWPVVRDAVGPASPLVRQGRRRAASVRRSLRALDRGAGTDDGVLADAAAAVLDHVEWQRDAVLPPLAAALGRSDAERAGERYTAALAAAPTRPHRFGLGSPVALKTLGRVLAKGDRLRDTLSRRGR